MLLTCKKGILDAQGNRKDVDKDFFLLFNVLDENKSWYLDENLKKNGDDPAKVNKADDAFKESNLMHSVNGRIYANLKGLDVCVGDRISWHLSGLGNEVDIHTGIMPSLLIVWLIFLHVYSHLTNYFEGWKSTAFVLDYCFSVPDLLNQI